MLEFPTLIEIRKNGLLTSKGGNVNQEKTYCTHRIWPILGHIISLFLLFLTFSGCILRQPTDPLWSDITLTDLNFIHDTLLIHSAPGANPKDHPFQNWLKEGFLQAGKQASQVKDKSGYMLVLQSYVNGFEIDHLSLNFSTGEAGKQLALPLRKHSPMGIEFINKGAWITLKCREL